MLSELIWGSRGRELFLRKRRRGLRTLRDCHNLQVTSDLPNACGSAVLDRSLIHCTVCCVLCNRCVSIRRPFYTDTSSTTDGVVKNINNLLYYVILVLSSLLINICNCNERSHFNNRYFLTRRFH